MIRDEITGVERVIVLVEESVAKVAHVTGEVAHLIMTRGEMIEMMTRGEKGACLMVRGKMMTRRQRSGAAAPIDDA